MFENGNLCERFSSGKEALRPVIFSHGLSGDKAFYMGVYHAFAANGHLVIAVNHFANIKIVFTRLSKISLFVCLFVMNANARLLLFQVTNSLLYYLFNCHL